MKKILETSLGRFSELVFDIDGRSIGDNELADLLIRECDVYDIYKKGGVIVHMSKKEYEELQQREL